jgi:hypothetical protein
MTLGEAAPVAAGAAHRGAFQDKLPGSGGLRCGRLPPRSMPGKGTTLRTRRGARLLRQQSTPRLDWHSGPVRRLSSPCHQLAHVSGTVRLTTRALRRVRPFGGRGLKRLVRRTISTEATCPAW